MLSKKPMKTIILSQLPHKERQEYFKFLLNNKITFTKEANGDYVTMIRVINPDYLSNESNEKNTVKSGKIGQKQKEIMNKNYYEKNSSDTVPDLAGNIRMRWNTAFYRMQLETGKAGENKPRIFQKNT